MVGKNVGKYRVLDRIGRGGMGTVYKAVDETLHREVAIKVLNAELNDPEVAKRFRSEAITIARLSHPGIATIYELFEYEGEWLMVMEFVRGETLENMVARMGPLSAQRAAEFCMQALAALAHAHSMGVVHRDLKPANLMVTENGSIKVMDFGIARVAGGEHLTNAGFMMGTPSYMAPEQVRGGDIDARADLYSMGVVFYRLVTAKLPFKGDTAFAMVQSTVHDQPTPISMVRPDLPPWVEEVVTRSLAKAPEHRFQSAAEFHEAFARCLAGLPLSSMYAAGAMDPGMTPSRPMSAGSFPRSMHTPSGQYQMTGSHVTILGPGTNPAAISSSTDPTVLTPALGHATGRLPAATPTPTAETQAPPTAATQAPPRSKSGMLLIAGAAVIVTGAVGAYFIFQRGGNQPTPDFQVQSTPAPVAPTPAPPQSPVPSPPTTGQSGLGSTSRLPPVGQSPAPSATPAAGGRGTAGAPIAGTTIAGARGTATPATSPTPTATPSPTPNAGDSVLATFTNIKLYVVTEKRTVDRDVLLNFLNGQVLVMPRNGGGAVATVPYRRILRATYTLGRDPKWDATLPGPPEGLDVGTFMRQTRHWLVVQGAETFAVLRLEGNNFRQILDTFELRTGLKVDRK
jgi:serine/threonine protein kinase